MKIMVDLDRVVFDCPSFLYWLANTFFSRTSLYRQLKYHEVDASEVQKYFNLLRFIKETRAENFVEIDGAVGILQKWNLQGIKIHFVTSRPNLKSLQKSAVDWLNENDIAYEKLIYACTNKPMYCMKSGIDIMVDDTLQNCVQSSRLRVMPVWFQPKQTEKTKRISSWLTTVSTWEEIDNVVQQVFEERKRRFSLQRNLSCMHSEDFEGEQ